MLRRLLTATLALCAAAAQAAPSPIWSTFLPSVYQTPNCLQSNSAHSASASSLTTTYASAQLAGDLNVVAVAWNASTGSISSVVDTKGNSYSVASPIVTNAGNASQAIYAAPNIAAALAGANAITVTLSGTESFVDIRAAECSGIASITPFDVQASGSGSSTAPATAAVTTNQPGEMLFGAAYVQGAVTGPGSGYTTLITSAGNNTIESRNVAGVGSYTASATQAPTGWWVANLATFRAAPITPGSSSSSSSSSSGGGSSSGSSSSGGSSGGVTLLSYLNSLRGSGTVLSGQHNDAWAGAAGGTYGNLLDIYSNSGSASTITISNCTSGNGSGGCTSSFTDTGKAPAIMGVWLNSPGSQASYLSSATSAQTLAAANGNMDAGGIVLVNWMPPSPTGGGGLGPNGNEFPAVITPGTAAYACYMYGCGATSSSPTGGVWGQAQAMLQLHRTAMIRILPENNGGWFWWGTGGSVTPAQFIALFQQTVTYMRSLGVTAVFFYIPNYFSGNYSQDDPGPSYRDGAGLDFYPSSGAPISGLTTATMVSDLSNSGSGMPYVQGLGIPLIFGEFGATSNNGALVLYTVDMSQYGVNGIQSGFSNFVGGVNWDQNQYLNGQLNAAGYLNNTVIRSAVPLYH